jgi:hypothetical protein
MTDKIVSIFNKQPVEATLNKEEVKDLLIELDSMKDELTELLVIALRKDDEMLVRSANMTRESAYFVLGLARLHTISGD